MKNFVTYESTPIGRLKMIGTATHIVELKFTKKSGTADPDLPDCMQNCQKQLQEYFQGTRQIFHLPLAPAGTWFQRSIWKELQAIPYGLAVSYGDIARRIGRPKAARAVGGANNANPIVIIIPCHRVIGSDGRMVGYGGALWRKEWLLSHEDASFHAGKIRYSK